jgi:hypothetical protein
MCITKWLITYFNPKKLRLTCIIYEDSALTAPKTRCLGYKKQSILYGEILIVCSDIRTKQINTLCGKNAESLKVRNGDTESK